MHPYARGFRLSTPFETCLVFPSRCYLKIDNSADAYDQSPLGEQARCWGIASPLRSLQHLPIGYRHVLHHDPVVRRWLGDCIDERRTWHLVPAPAV